MQPNAELVPNQAQILEIKVETPDVTTYTLAFSDQRVQEAYEYQPGQFNMVSLPGIGEAAISISSSPKQKDAFEHTVRKVGRVTTALTALGIGDKLGIRGPYGRPWPVEALKGKDVAVIVGGTGCACIKPAINILVDNRADYKSATVLFGAKTPEELLYADQFQSWQDQGLELLLTVDKGRPSEWPYHVGVVTTLFDKLPSPAHDSYALIAGPDIMMRFSVVDLLNRGWERSHIFLSLERRMDCAVSMCGHCMLGPKYVCNDGPVFSYEEIKDLFGVVA